jgi:hypothetical protein
MSQTPEQYYVFLKLHEAFIKMCDVSIKTLESMEQKEGIDSNIKSQMENLVIENLNLFQDKAFIENIQGDKIMQHKKEEKIEILFGDNAHISGDFIVAKSIENSFNKVTASDLTNELKELLKELSIEVGKLTEHLPKDEAENIADDLDTLVEKTTCEKPKRKWWSVSIDGLTKAAENLGKVGEPVLELISKIVPLLMKISV